MGMAFSVTTGASRPKRFFKTKVSREAANFSGSVAFSPRTIAVGAAKGTRPPLLTLYSFGSGKMGHSPFPAASAFVQDAASRTQVREINRLDMVITAYLFFGQMDFIS